tara:strand:+ start:1985 stop:2476 length:492 start_codon:yes stop_codon:yes gene_type:complete
MNIFSSKKGVSPLVATVLLIAFAVALGAVVMSYGSSYYEGASTETAYLSGEELCNNINLEVHKVNNVNQICYEDKGAIRFTLVNKANIDIEKIRVLVTGEDIYVTELNSNYLKPGYPRSEELSYDFNAYGEIKQVEFIPIIKNGELEQLCFDNAVLKERIRKC